MNRFKETVECYKDINLVDLGMYFRIIWDNISDSARKNLEEIGINEEETDLISVIDVTSEGLWDALDPYDYIQLESEKSSVMKHLIKEAPYYLVMAHNCRWNGASGYTIVDDILSTLMRDYDVSIYPVNVSKGGKCLVCSEHSHDVPTGAKTSIIALTKSEYDILSHWDTDLITVERFDEKCESKACI